MARMAAASMTHESGFHIKDRKWRKGLRCLLGERGDWGDWGEGRAFNRGERGGSECWGKRGRGLRGNARAHGSLCPPFSPQSRCARTPADASRLGGSGGRSCGRMERMGEALRNVSECFKRPCIPSPHNAPLPSAPPPPSHLVTFSARSASSIDSSSHEFDLTWSTRTERTFSPTAVRSTPPASFSAFLPCGIYD
jgi:hypothetical protein